jgi:hypothetical protein
MGGYVQNLAKKYLILAGAGAIFGTALVFAMLAAFWALLARNNDPVLSAGIMAGILAIVGLLIAFVAYGSTANNKPPSVSAALKSPVDTVRANVPAVDDVGRQIEYAVRQYGPMKVAAAAAGAGLIVGFIAKKTRQI